MDLYRRAKDANILVIPGKKLCPTCRRKIYADMAPIPEARDSSEDEDIFQIEHCVSLEESKLELSDCFASIGISPIKTHSQPSTSKSKTGKRKLETAFASMTEKVARALDVPVETVQPTSSFSFGKKIEEKAINFDKMMDLLAEKVKTLSTKSSKMQILTLAPQNWTIQGTAQFFNVSEYLVRSARKLANQKGILALPDPKKAPGISKSTIALVESFYHDEEFTREMPGKKDCVSIARNIHRQKRLILCNLKELFTAFKLKNPEAKIGFSKFCSFRPKWCVLAGASGTHSVCVCTIHQNIKLLLAPLNVHYKDLLKYLVCSPDRRECMVQWCSECPKSTDSLEDYLLQLLSEEYEQDQPIEFWQWMATDHANLIQQKESQIDYVELVVSQMQKLTAHSYISKAQAKYLKKRKEQLECNTALFLGDFAENYKFVVQDEVQGFHWNNLQCSLHPVVIYYKENSLLKHISYCVLSDDLNHDVSFVYQVQKVVLSHLKVNCPFINNVEYFSDGCGGQYKNRKSFLNLCKHQDDFNMSAVWNFFATSHGKQPCDGIGGTVKRLVAKASLQHSQNDHILDHKSMFEFCKSNITDIEFFFVEKEELIGVRKMLEERFQHTIPVPGTRSFHQYTPTSDCTVGVKRCSEDDNYSIVHNLLSGIKVQKDLNISDFVACIYDGKWWIGIILNIYMDEDDIYIKFMHPNGPARSFLWPASDDTCLVPACHILCTIEVPVTTTGRQYKLNENDTEKISKEFAKYTVHLQNK